MRGKGRDGGEGGGATTSNVGIPGMPDAHEYPASRIIRSFIAGWVFLSPSVAGNNQQQKAAAANHKHRSYQADRHKNTSYNWSPRCGLLVVVNLEPY